MIKVNQVKVLVENNNDNSILKALLKKTRLNKEDIKTYKIYKQSIDARDKNNIYFVYEIIVDTDKKIKLNNDISIYKEEKYNPIIEGKNILNERPIIVGAGPAGLFCALLLSRLGYKPIIIEKGKCVEERSIDVENFFKTNKLNINSNIQFGEGGAGTYSDGKLNTGIKDFRIREVLNTFVKFGAKEDILYSFKPHIGTDILVDVIKNIRSEIEKNGGEYWFSTELIDINIDNSKLSSVKLNKDGKEIIIKTNVLVLAIGHSSRNTFYMLENKLDLENKPFAVGLRVIHDQDKINESQYGLKYKDMLGSSPYKLTYHSKSGRGVYSFCMCPGGYVVNASSEENMLAVNGMSYNARNSYYANSAIVVTVNNKDYGDKLFSGIEFQRKLESIAYKLGNSYIPVQYLEDYHNNTVKNTKLNDKPFTIKGNYTFANLNELFNDDINNSIKEAMQDFSKKLKCFNDPDTLLLGVETRTSSPIRIIRNDNLESNIENVYPCGEGAGYAGGIVSAAVDGLKVAEQIIKKWRI